MILHTLSALPDTPACRDCLALMAPDDALLLLGDGTYAATAGSTVLGEVLATGIKVYVLQDDACARGLGGHLGDGVIATDMAGFVALTERYPRQQAWY